MNLHDFISITAKDNLAVKAYVRLATLRKYRDQTGLFAMETTKLLLEAALAKRSLEKIFVTPKTLGTMDLSMQQLLQNAKQVYTITDEIATKMTQTKNAGGIFAIGKKLDKCALSATIIKSGHYVYLCDLQDAGNVGTILRTAKALGYQGVIVSRNTVDVYSLKVLRASMGAVFSLPILFGEDLLVDLAHCNTCSSTYASVLHEEARDVREVDFPENSVLVIGNEGNGLPPEVAAICQHQITIVMQGEMESLNAAMAAGILMWEMQHSKHNRTTTNRPEDHAL